MENKVLKHPHKNRLGESEDLGREMRDAKCSPVEKLIGFCS